MTALARRAPARNGLATAALATLLAACGPERPGLEPRHLLLVTVDSLRADRCSFLMHAPRTTHVPSDELERSQGRAFGLDDLAAQGVAFARCYAPSPLADVSLATLFTSLPPLEHGLTSGGARLAGENVTLAECLAAAGFASAAFCGGGRAPEPSIAQGFQHVASFERRAEALRAAADWLATDPGSGRRRFAWVHLAGLAPPWDAEHEPLAAQHLATRTFVDPAYRGRAGERAWIEALHAGAPASAEDLAALGGGYDRELFALTLDLWVGLARAYDFHTGRAEASETWARTLLVVAGTNGIELGERGQVGSAGSLSEAALRVPLVLRHPDSLTGERILEPIVGLDDVMPTLLEWFELPRPSGLRGRSLLALTDRDRAGTFVERPAFAQLPERVFSVRTSRWHLVWNPLGARPAGRPPAAGELPVLSLHEPALDPRERRDLAARQGDVTAELQAAIRAWREPQVPFGDRPRAGSRP